MARRVRGGFGPRIKMQRHSKLPEFPEPIPTWVEVIAVGDGYPVTVARRIPTHGSRRRAVRALARARNSMYAALRCRWRGRWPAWYRMQLLAIYADGTRVVVSELSHRGIEWRPGELFSEAGKSG
jgi:hypothetical protein